MKRPNSLTLIIDTKPRFRAQWDMNGLSAAHHYRRWREGAFIPFSYRLPRGAGLDENVWKIARSTTPNSRGLVLIAQTDDRDLYPWLDYVIRQFYRQADRKRDLYLYEDEMMAFLAGKPSLQKGTIQAIASGGERGVAFLGATQRPKGIPVAAMTEMTKLYCFRLDYNLDIKRLWDMGLPHDFLPPEDLYYFRYFDKMSRQTGLKILSLPAGKK